MVIPLTQKYTEYCENTGNILLVNTDQVSNKNCLDPKCPTLNLFKEWPQEYFFEKKSLYERFKDGA